MVGFVLFPLVVFVGQGHQVAGGVGVTIGFGTMFVREEAGFVYCVRTVFVDDLFEEFDFGGAFGLGRRERMGDSGKLFEGGGRFICFGGFGENFHR
jgi:hypothetical protein